MQSTLTKKTETRKATDNTVASSRVRTNDIAKNQDGVPLYLQRSQDVQSPTNDAQTQDEEAQTDEPSPRIGNDIKLAPSRTPHPRQDVGTGYVGSFYFYTHQAELGSADREMLRQIAEEYQFVVSPQQETRARTAEPPRAYVHGHADMRVARRPNNITLSSQRAEAVREQFLSELNSFSETGSVSFDVYTEADGVAECLQNSACERGDSGAMALARRADLYIRAEQPTVRKEEQVPQQLYEGLSEEEKKKVIEATRELRREGVPWDAILEVGGKFILEIIGEFSTAVSIITVFYDLITAYENALIGKNFVLSPFACKGFAYGVTSWAFADPSLKELMGLRRTDAEVLAIGHRKPQWIPQATLIWQQALKDGYDTVHKKFYQEPLGESKRTMSKRAVVQALVRRQFINDPKIMAKTLCNIKIKQSHVLTGPANTELARQILSCDDYPN